jgi:hypothetical protein
MGGELTADFFGESYPVGRTFDRFQDGCHDLIPPLSMSTRNRGAGRLSQKAPRPGQFRN